MTSCRSFALLSATPWVIQESVGDRVGCCQSNSSPLGTINGLSWLLLTDEVVCDTVTCPLVRGEQEREDEEQERDAPIPLL